MIRMFEYGAVPNETLFIRSPLFTDVGPVVAEILRDVKENGDAALYRLTEKFDGAKLDSLLVTDEEIEEAFAAVSAEYRAVLQLAHDNIAECHRNQIRPGFVMTRPNGVVLGQKVTPIARVGLYVPNGTAAYPSSLLMNCVPAKLAGCGMLVITTPPGPDGRIDPAILAAAKIAGVDRIYKLGGAQAVAALAYGTESVPKVDKIVGPGNAYVAEAKKQVFGTVAIDTIAGPSEVLIVADDTNDPAVVAADMLAQAEHDVMATSVLVTDSRPLAEAVAQELERQLRLLPREDIARASIENNGKIVIAENLDDAIACANEIAPEHLEICLDDAFSWLGKVENAGSIFLGKHAPEALGDYLAGPNHTLPTTGTAKFGSPLSVDDFVKKSQYTYYSAEALEDVKDALMLFAEEEGLRGHARSVGIRFGEAK
ncbi:MAG: histidinol dehydrogenase [Oscillospiraceae bacterium]|nr:histidinol dehydrogenase [Oscillospiraceae bacterium]MBQ9046225.1 histidinol dehydrogenase [Oscillospiraceae bacterium]